MARTVPRNLVYCGKRVDRRDVPSVRGSVAAARQPANAIAAQFAAKQASLELLKTHRHASVTGYRMSSLLSRALGYLEGGIL